MAKEYVPMKEQDKNREQQEIYLRKMFRVTIIKISQNFRRTDAQSKKLQEVFSKELENVKSNQIDLNNITEMKNTLEGHNSRINEAAEWISELEEWWKSSPWNRIKKKRKIQRQFKRPLEHHQIPPNSHDTHFRRRREKGPGKVFDEIIADNFPNMGKETVTQVSYRINTVSHTELTQRETCQDT